MRTSWGIKRKEANETVWKPENISELEASAHEDWSKIPTERGHNVGGY